MNNYSKNTVNSKNEESLEIKKRSLFEKIGYSFRQVIITFLCSITTPHKPSNSYFWTNKDYDSHKKNEDEKKVTNDILNDYIDEDPIDKKRFVFIKEHFKRRSGFHGFMFSIIPSLILFFMIVSPIGLFGISVGFGVVGFLAFLIIVIITGLVTKFVWKFYGLSWFLKGFEKDVMRYTFNKNFKKTDEHKVRHVGGIVLQSFKENGLDIDEVIASLSKKMKGK